MNGESPRLRRSRSRSPSGEVNAGTIYVGGIPHEMDDKGLKDAFACIGEVVDTKVRVAQACGRGAEAPGAQGSSALVQRGWTEVARFGMPKAGTCCCCSIINLRNCTSTTLRRSIDAPDCTTLACLCSRLTAARSPQLQPLPPTIKTKTSGCCALRFATTWRRVAREALALSSLRRRQRRTTRS